MQTGGGYKATTKKSGGLKINVIREESLKIFRPNGRPVHVSLLKLSLCAENRGRCIQPSQLVGTRGIQTERDPREETEIVNNATLISFMYIYMSENKTLLTDSRTCISYK